MADLRAAMQALMLLQLVLGLVRVLLHQPTLLGPLRLLQAPLQLLLGRESLELLLLGELVHLLVQLRVLVPGKRHPRSLPMSMPSRC